MKLTEISIHVFLPEGYVATGEYRAPKMNEPYLAIDAEGDWSVMMSSRDHAKHSTYIILMKTPKVRIKSIKKVKRG